MLYVRLLKWYLNILLVCMPGLVFSASQLVVQVDLIEDDPSVFSDYLYVADVLPDAGVSYESTTVFGLYGYFFLNAEGVWAYITEKNRSDIQRLGKGDYLTESFNVVDVNGKITTVVVNINGVNDKAVISGNSAAVVWEDQVGRSRVLRTLGKLEISDVDEGESLFSEAEILGLYGRLNISETGIWAYTANNSLAAIQALAAGDSLLETFVVHGIDGTGHEVLVTIKGVNDLANVQGVDAGVVIEDDDVQHKGVLQVEGKLDVTDKDNGEAGFVADFNVGRRGYFYIDDSGHWNYLALNESPSIQSLSDGEVFEESFSVSTIDGTAHAVSVSILGVEEPGVRALTSLSWRAPLVRENGESLPQSEIGGYHLYYGFQSGQYIFDQQIGGGSTQSFPLSDLTDGKYYFVMTAYDSRGRESEYTEEFEVLVGSN